MHTMSDDEFERRFDAGEDMAGYIDVSVASRPNQERRSARHAGTGTFHMYEFEIFEEDGWFLAFPFDFLGGTQGESYAEACEMAADWLRVECEHCAMHDEDFPPATFGNEPRHGGKVVVVGVEASKDTVRKVTTSEAARRLGVSPDRVSQMIAASQLEAFRDDGRTWVTLDSIEARAVKTRRFDAANYISTTEDVVEYMNAVLEENDPNALTRALGTVARFEGMTLIAERTGLKREGLYTSLGEGGNPSFATVCKVLAACGLKLQIMRDADQDLALA